MLENTQHLIKHQLLFTALPCLGPFPAFRLNNRSDTCSRFWYTRNCVISCTSFWLVPKTCTE